MFPFLVALVTAPLWVPVAWLAWRMFTATADRVLEGDMRRRQRRAGKRRLRDVSRNLDDYIEYD